MKGESSWTETELSGRCANYGLLLTVGRETIKVRCGVGSDARSLYLFCSLPLVRRGRRESREHGPVLLAATMHSEPALPWSPVKVPLLRRLLHWSMPANCGGPQPLREVPLGQDELLVISL